VDIHLLEGSLLLDKSAITGESLPGPVFNSLVTQVGGAGVVADGIVKFNVAITLTDADDNIKPGFTAISSIVTGQATDVLLIPVTAIYTLDGQKVVRGPA
jgi:hypothetical protein